MEDTYTIMRVFAGSWGLVFMFFVFLAVVLYTLRPGSRRTHSEIANIPFRNDDRPAPRAPAASAEAQEARS